MMVNNELDAMIGQGALIGIIMGISQLLKNMGMNPKFVPIVNVLVGVVVYAVFSGMELRMGVFYGLISGLTASGLYSSQKNLRQFVSKGE